MGRGQRSAAQGPAPRPGVGAGARAGQAASAHAPLHPHAVHPGPQARIPRRAGPRPRPRDVRAAPVLPGRWRDGAARSALGRGALVGLIPRLHGSRSDDAAVAPAPRGNRGGHSRGDGAREPGADRERRAARHPGRAGARRMDVGRGEDEGAPRGNRASPRGGGRRRRCARRGGRLPRSARTLERAACEDPPRGTGTPARGPRRRLRGGAAPDRTGAHADQRGVRPAPRRRDASVRAREELGLDARAECARVDELLTARAEERSNQFW